MNSVIYRKLFNASHILQEVLCYIKVLCKEWLKLTQPNRPGNLPKFDLMKKKVCTNSIMVC